MIISACDVTKLTCFRCVTQLDFELFDNCKQFHLSVTALVAEYIQVWPARWDSRVHFRR